MKILFCIAVSMLQSILLFGQLRVQRAMFTQYHFNALAINPAYSAIEDEIRLTALSRHQWVGFKGAPQTQTLTAAMPLANEKTSVGLYLINDKIGVETEQAVFATLAQKVQLSEKAYLSAGFTAGAGFYLGDYHSLTELDPVFSTVSEWRSNFGLGVLYYDDQWEAGVSVPYFVKFGLSGTATSAGVSKIASDVYLTANYRFAVNEYIKAKPSVLVKYTAGVPLQFDANVNAYFDEKGLWLGLGYRSNSAFLAMFQVRL